MHVAQKIPWPVLFRIAWGALWRSFGIMALVFFVVGALLVGAVYVAINVLEAQWAIAFVSAHMEKVDDFFVVVLYAGAIIGPVLALRMMLGRKFGDYRLILLQESIENEVEQPSEPYDGGPADGDS